MSWHKDTHIAVLIIFQLFEGIGVGCCFQPAMLALKADRAVATGLRNFIRTTGGAVGLSISSSILNNVLIANFPPTVSAADALQFTNLKDLTPEERDGVIDTYMKGIQTILYLGAPMVGVMLLDTLVHVSGVSI
ncbi:hypothetical protein BGX38DRAFT_828940 [Terfezia claveryi]|nr:hypothetical protein BGX38DRAFT_828940 [Terfezia claveryi]